MFKFSGVDGSLWLIGDEAPFSVPLLTEDGWVWRSSDPCLRHWLEVTVVDGAGEEVHPEHVTLRSGRLELSRALSGPLRAEGTCRPLSLVARFGLWELTQTMLGGERVFGGNRPKTDGGAVAVLSLPEAEGGFHLPDGPESLLASLWHVHTAFSGLVDARDTAGGQVAIKFKEEVHYEPC